MTVPHAPRLSAPELPLDRPRPAQRDLRTASVSFAMPATLRQVSEACGVGLPATTLALYLVLLHRYSGQSDLAVGCVETAGLIRSEVTGERTFRDLVHLVHKDLADDTPLSFSVGDLALWVGDEGGQLVGRFTFATDVLESDTVHRAVGHLLRLLEGVADDPDQGIGTLPLLTVAEEELVTGLNQALTDPVDQTFPQLFEAQAARTPDAIAVRTELTCLSYGELNRRANQLAHLLHELGVGPEVTVGLCLERGAQLVVAVLGVLKVGGAYVPVDPQDPAERRTGILRDAEVRVVITENGDALGDALDNAHTPVELDHAWTAIEGRPCENPPTPESALAHTAYLLYTSGSTGKPKGVVVEHRQLASYTMAVIQRFALTQPLSWAMVQPLTVDSSVTALVPPLCTGGQVHLLSREQALDAEKLADWTQRWNVDCLKIAPSHLRALQSSPRFTDLLPRRLLVIGGEASDWRWLQELQRLMPDGKVFNHYGPTETTVGALTLAVADHPRAGWEAAPIGVPLPNTRAYVVDPSGRQVPAGVTGELLIGGDNVARGYHRRDDLTAECFIPDLLSGRPDARLYRTGDVVRRLSDGTIAFLGRRDDQIKVRGFRVELGEIDAALKSHDGVRHAVTIVREDTPGDRRIVGYVEPHKPGSVTVPDLERHVRERISAHMVPQALVVLDRLPLSGHGKIERGALPAPAAEHSNDWAPLPRNELERQVAAVWKSLFHTETVGVEENFFDLGGHSLLLVELQHRLRADLDRDVELLDLFQHTTVRAQAEFLSRQEQPAAPATGGATGAQQNALLRRRQQQLQAKRGHHG